MPASNEREARVSSARRLGPALCFVLLASCTAHGPRSAPRAKAVHAAPTPTSTARATAPPQRFADDAVEMTFADPGRLGKITTSLREVDAAVDAEFARQKLPGLAFGVVVDGRLVHTHNLGASDLASKSPVDAETVFRIGSITKTFTAAAALLARDEGKLVLDEPATRLVPDLGSVVYPTRDARPITLRDLLTHTAGLPRMGKVQPEPGKVVGERELLAGLRDLPLQNVAETAYSYSNLGFALVGIAVAHATGSSYRSYVQSRLLAPLAMTSTRFDPPSAGIATGYRRKGGNHEVVPTSQLGAFEGAGGLYSTLSDMSRFVAFQLDAYPARGTPERGPLARASVRDGHQVARRKRVTVDARPEAKKGETSAGVRADGVGLGWHSVETCELDQLVWHNGSVDGFSAGIAFLPRQGVGAIALTNDDDGDADRIVEQALVILQRGGGLAPRVAVLKPSPLFERALRSLVDVQNDWNEGSYTQMLSATHRREVPMEQERTELGEYARRHGRCQPGPAIEVKRPLVAKFALTCERGRLEMGVSLAEDGTISGFTGESFDIPPSPVVRSAADRVAGLIRTWSDATYARMFEPKFKKPKVEMQAFFTKARTAHRECRLARPLQYDGPEAQTFALSCEQGGDMVMSIRLAPGSADHVVRFTLDSIAPKKCPVR